MNQDGDAGTPRSGVPQAMSRGDAIASGLSDHTQKRIGLHLRTLYDTLVQQPVPDRFHDLIARLEAADSDPDDQI